MLNVFKHIEENTCIRFRHVSDYIYESRLAITRYAFIFKTNESECKST